MAIFSGRQKSRWWLIYTYRTWPHLFPTKLENVIQSFVYWRVLAHTVSERLPSAVVLGQNATPRFLADGSTFDQSLTFDHHIKKLLQSCGSCQNHLSIAQEHRKRKSSLLLSRLLDYCNSLFFLLVKRVSAVSRLQLVENTAADAKRPEYITPIVAHLQRPPVRFRIQFKILLITFKALYAVAAACIAELLTLRWLSDQSLLNVSQSRLKTNCIYRFSSNFIEWLPHHWWVSLVCIPLILLLHRV